MKKLFLHIGAHKTGSTSLQNFLHHNRDELARRGVLYPQEGLDGTGHHALAWATGIGPRHPRDDEQVRQWLAAIVAAADRDDIHSVVISTELFEHAVNLQLLQSLAAHFSVSVVAYLRKQDHYLESAYNQHVRMYEQRFTGSIYQFALRFNAFARYNYRVLTHYWEQQFGRDSIVVRPYGTSRVDKDVRRDFLSLIDGGLAELADSGFDEVRDNISLSAPAMPYLSRINCLALKPQEHRQAMLALAARVPQNRHARLLDNEEASQFYQQFASGNRYVFDRYLGADQDPFQELVTDPQEHHHVAHDDFDIELLLDVMQQEQLGLPMLQLLRQRGPA